MSSSSAATSVSLANLSNDILTEIFRFLDPRSLLTSVAPVNKQFYQLASDNTIWEHLVEQAHGFQQAITDTNTATTTKVPQRSLSAFGLSIATVAATPPSSISPRLKSTRVTTKGDERTTKEVIQAILTNEYINPLDQGSGGSASSSADSSENEEETLSAESSPRLRKYMRQAQLVDTTGIYAWKIEFLKRAASVLFKHYHMLEAKKLLLQVKQNSLHNRKESLLFAIRKNEDRLQSLRDQAQEAASKRTKIAAASGWHPFAIQQHLDSSSSSSQPRSVSASPFIQQQQQRQRQQQSLLESSQRGGVGGDMSCLALQQKIQMEHAALIANEENLHNLDKRIEHFRRDHQQAQLLAQEFYTKKQQVDICTAILKAKQRV